MSWGRVAKGTRCRCGAEVVDTTDIAERRGGMLVVHGLFHCYSRIRTPEPADLQQVGASSRWVEDLSAQHGSLPTGGVLQEGG